MRSYGFLEELENKSYPYDFGHGEGSGGALAFSRT